MWTLPLIPSSAPPPDLHVAVHTWVEVVALYADWIKTAATIADWNTLVTNPKP